MVLASAQASRTLSITTTHDKQSRLWAKYRYLNNQGISEGEERTYAQRKGQPETLHGGCAAYSDQFMSDISGRSNLRKAVVFSLHKRNWCHENRPYPNGCMIWLMVYMTCVRANVCGDGIGPPQTSAYRVHPHGCIFAHGAPMPPQQTLHQPSSIANKPPPLALIDLAGWTWNRQSMESPAGDDKAHSSSSLYAGISTRLAHGALTDSQQFEFKV